jgi:hypothetical protein
MSGESRFPGDNAMTDQKRQESPATDSGTDPKPAMPKKPRQKRPVRFVRSLKELTDDERFTIRSIEHRCRTHPDGRVETLMTKVTLHSERDTAKILHMRDALKAAGHWPQEGT